MGPTTLAFSSQNSSFFLRTRGFPVSLSEGWLCKTLESCLQEQPGWLLPQIAAAGGDEQERERSLWSLKSTQQVGGSCEERRGIKTESRTLPACARAPARLRD